MNEKIKQQWIAALRSGKYEQGQSKLKSGNKFCCLGVLCDISPYRSEIEGLVLLSQNVQDWAELDSSCGFMKELVSFNNSRCSKLSDLNDKGMPFSEIADVIQDLF